MDDLISRQAAIGAVLKVKVDEDESLLESPFECNRMIDCAVEELKRLPSAQPTHDDGSNTLDALDCVAQRKGEWTWTDEAVFGNPYGSYKCDCGNYMPHKTNFCPNCGCAMKGEDDETD